MPQAIDLAAGKSGYGPTYFQRLRDIGATVSLRIEYQATRRVRGWPEKSKKPWSLRYQDGTLVCAFASLEALERNLRGRAGC